MSPPSRTTTDPSGPAASQDDVAHLEKEFDARAKILGPEFDAASNDPNSVGWPSRCRWSIASGSHDKDPHHHVRVNYTQNRATLIQDSILDFIGQTPVVRLQKLPQANGIKCEILVKCEFMNPGGSIKDRIALRMVDEAEREGLLVPHSGYTIIEPTSGNTGIGLALVSARRGYRCIIVMPEKMSAEKANTLRALGAELVRTPTEAAYNAPESHISEAIRLKKSIGKSIILNQYRASGNPLAHYDGTAEEILVACCGAGGSEQQDASSRRGQVDMLVAGAGTGGTLSGLARKFKQRLPGCKIVGVDPIGSILAQPDHLNLSNNKQGGFYEVEGIGYDFIPTVLDRSLVDLWVKSGDEQSFRMARELIRLEGLLVGGSSGAAMWAALEAVRRSDWAQDSSKRIVVLLPDGIRNYMSRFVSDAWMAEREFLPSPQSMEDKTE